MNSVRPYRLVSEQRLQSLEAIFDQIVTYWKNEWFVGPLEIRNTCVEVSPESSFHTNLSPKGASWVVYRESPDLWVAHLHDLAQSGVLLESMFNTHLGASFRPTPIVRGVYAEALCALVQLIFKKANLAVPDTSGTSLPPVDIGGGVVRVEIKLPVVTLVFFCGGAMVDVLAAPTVLSDERPPLDDRMAGLSHTKVNVEMIVGEVELNVRDLMQIEIGDVIRLNRKISEDFELVVEQHSTDIGLRLGLLEEHKAVVVN